jgi:hypothetical protein
MAHRDAAIAGAATGAVRQLLASDATAGGLARDAVRAAARPPAPPACVARRCALILTHAQPYGLPLRPSRRPAAELQGRPGSGRGARAARQRGASLVEGSKAKADCLVASLQRRPGP